MAACFHSQYYPHDHPRSSAQLTLAHQIQFPRNLQEGLRNQFLSLLMTYRRDLNRKLWNSRVLACQSKERRSAKIKRMRQMVGRVTEIRAGHPGQPVLLAPVSCEAWPPVRFPELTQHPRCLHNKMGQEG